MTLQLNHQYIATLSPDEAAEVMRMYRYRAQCMHCEFEPAPEMRAEYSNDINKPHRRGTLLEGVDARRGADRLTSPERFSSGFIVEQAAERFFHLAFSAEAGLRGRFTPAEFSYILNAECTPIWSWDRFTSVATMVADDNGIDSLDELKEDAPLRTLLEKLVALTPLENAVLVDVCERVWRGYDNPLL